MCIVSFSYPEEQAIKPGISREVLIKILGKSEERTYRRQGNDEWITFNLRQGQDIKAMVTYYMANDVVVRWVFNDRQEVVDEYLSEFSPLVLKQSYPKIYNAIRQVFKRIPQDVFLLLTDRNYPVVFTEYYHKGPGRLANSIDVWNLDDDPPAFSKGFYLVKLSSELETANDASALVAIIAHELAHRVLQHGSSAYSLTLEKAANRLIKKWGFTEEFLKATKVKFVE